MTCEQACEIYSRVCGYYRPIANWNRGKLAEWRERRVFQIAEEEDHANRRGLESDATPTGTAAS